MSPLFQLFYSIAYWALDESLIPTGLFNCLIPTGFIQLLIPWMSPLFQLVLFNFFIPMAALIWSHFLFNNWFYSTTATAYSTLVPLMAALFNFLFRWPPLFGRTLFNFLFLFNLNGRPYLVALFIQLFIFIQLKWPPLFGHSYFIPCLITTDLLFFFFFFLWKKVSYLGFEPGTS